MDTSIILFLIIVLAFVPVLLRLNKQNRELKAIAQVQASLEVGDEVITSTGLYGRVAQLEADRVQLEIAPDVRTTWDRRAIARRAVNLAES